MKLVIDIPKAIYESTKTDLWCGSPTVGQAIANGIILPKGCGRLIDADKLANDINTLKDNWYRDFNMNEYESGRYESYDYAVDVINDAPTIIEADKETEND